MSDLDARVAALMAKALNLAGQTGENYGHPNDPIRYRLETELREAIRAELQKPALHEPITDTEIDSARKILSAVIHIDYSQKRVREVISCALESFLQGRAKPAQEEITDAEIYKIILKMEQSPSFSYDTRDRDLVRAGIRASKGEKT